MLETKTIARKRWFASEANLENLKQILQDPTLKLAFEVLAHEVTEPCEAGRLDSAADVRLARELASRSGYIKFLHDLQALTQPEVTETPPVPDDWSHLENRDQ